MVLSRVKQRKLLSRADALSLLQEIVKPEADMFRLYKGLYGLWLRNNAALQELRPLFRLPGIEPDGRMSITPEFKRLVQDTARSILPHFGVEDKVQ